MANLNLSQFGENTSVSDADYTFVWDTAASISKKVSRNSWLNSGTLTSDAPVTISQTWNGTGSTVFTALKVNATTPGTTSSSSSLLLDLQVGGVSQLSVTKAGAVNVTGAVSTPAQFIAGDAIFANGNGVRYVSTWIRSAGFDGGLLFRNNTQTQSVGVVVEADNTLALRNGAGVPQTFRVYNTFLGTTANEWFEIDWKVSAGTVRLFTMHGGTGVARNIDISAGATLFFGAGSGSPIKMYSGNVERWNISATGHFIAAADNSYDIGASGANRPRNVYVGSSIVLGTATFNANGFTFPNKFIISESGADGRIAFYNGSGGAISRLQLGGVTDTFPAIAPDGAGIKFTGAAAGSTSWIKVPPVAVSALPLAATAGAGARAFVNDASSPTFGSAVTGGGAVLVPVYSTGSAWHVG